MNLHRTAAQRRRALFFPIVFRLAARLEQLEWDEFIGDATYQSFSLRTAHRLFQYDWVLNHFDTALEAEALGASVHRTNTGEVVRVEGLQAPPASADAALLGNVPAVLEATQRLSQELKDTVPVVGVVTGPLTLATQLWGGGAAAGADRRERLSFTEEVAVKLVQRYCSDGVGGLLVVEDPAVDAGEAGAYLQPILNIAAYYQAPVLHLLRNASITWATEGHPGKPSLPAITPLPEDFLLNETDVVGSQVSQELGRNPLALLGALSETPPETPAEALHAVRERLMEA